MGNDVPTLLTGVAAVSSVDFVRTVFRLYARRSPFVIVADPAAAKNLPGVEIGEIVDPAAGGGWVGVHQAPIHETALAQVNFTSGTEGAPKGIALGHDTLASVTDRLNAAMGLDSSVREYVGVPAYHSFGLARFRACAAAGGDAFVPANGFDIAEIVAMLATGEINAISAVPTLWRVLLAHESTIGELGARVRWVEIGSQYMSRAEKEALKTLFPNARIVQHYGLTEASRSTLLLISGTEGEALESVGAPPPGCEIRIEPDGRIAVRGPHVAPHRVTAQGLVALTDADGWLITSDLGHLHEGRLFYDGRADDQINCGGVKLMPETLEAHLRAALPGDPVLAVARIPNPLRGDGVLIAVAGGRAHDLKQVRATGRRILAELGLSVGDALHVRHVVELPVTATGKVRRAELPRLVATAAEEPVASAAAAEAAGHEAGDTPSAFLAAVQDALEMPHIAPDATFFDLGGDSLSAINMMLRMESLKVPKPLVRAFLDGASIDEVIAMEAADGTPVAPVARRPMLMFSDAINATRGVFVVWLVLLHWMPGILAQIGLPMSANFWLVPAYRLGTPSFAIMFGLTVGFYHFHGLESNAQRIKGNLWIAFWTISSGIVALAIFRAMHYYVLPETEEDNIYPYLFFSVLTYYVVAIPCVPLWHRMFRPFQDKRAAAICAAVICLALSVGLASVISPLPVAGWRELPRLMLSAKYDYFGMTGMVMLGAALGIQMRALVDRKGLQLRPVVGGSLSAGIALVLLGAIVSIDAGVGYQWWGIQKAPIFAIISYLGVVLIALAAALAYSGREQRGLAFRIFVIFGLLSLPIFVMHSMVIPAKDFLEALRFPFALAVPLAIFLLCVGWATLKLYRLNYGVDGGSAADERLVV